MLKKIQNYLLRNYPIVWNTKFIPMGITVIIFNIFFFFFGFFAGENFYSIFKRSFLSCLISFLASILILIIWLIFYFKNNGLKSFYPKNTNELYLEWLLTFILISGNLLYFYSYFQGIKFNNMKNYDSDILNLDIFILFPLYIALSLSLAIFSFRVTSGKAWLISFVISGLLSFIGGIITLFSNLGLTYYNYWALIFIVMCINMAIMLIKKQSKSIISSLMINLIIWMVPHLYMLYLYTFMDKEQEYFFTNYTSFSWINLILVIVILPFVCKIIIKWRALPEE